MKIKTFKSGVSTFVLVTILSVMVWVWAEGESLRSGTVEVLVTFNDHQVDAGIKVYVADPTWAAQVRIDLDGATVAIDRARRAVNRTIELRPGEDGVPSEEGTYRLTLRDVIAQTQAMVDAGVTVTAVEPETVTIEVVRFVSRAVPLLFEPPAGLEINEAMTTIEPGEVIVTMPSAHQDVLESIESVPVRVAAEDIDRLVEGKPITINGLVELPKEAKDTPRSKIGTKRAQVTLQVRTQVDVFVDESVPVWISAPPRALSRFDITFGEQAQPLLKVTARGARAALEPLRAGSVKIKGYVELTTGELQALVAAGETSKELPIVFVAPSGVVIESETETVRVEFAPRDGGDEL